MENTPPNKKRKQRKKKRKHNNGKEGKEGKKRKEPCKHDDIKYTLLKKKRGKRRNQQDMKKTKYGVISDNNNTNAVPYIEDSLPVYHVVRNVYTTGTSPHLSGEAGYANKCDRIEQALAYCAAMENDSELNNNERGWYAIYRYALEYKSIELKNKYRRWCETKNGSKEKKEKETNLTDPITMEPVKLKHNNLKIIHSRSVNHPGSDCTTYVSWVNSTEPVNFNYNPKTKQVGCVGCPILGCTSIYTIDAITKHLKRYLIHDGGPVPFNRDGEPLGITIKDYQSIMVKMLTIEALAKWKYLHGLHGDHLCDNCHPKPTMKTYHYVRMQRVGVLRGIEDNKYNIDARTKLCKVTNPRDRLKCDKCHVLYCDSCKIYITDVKDHPSSCEGIQDNTELRKIYQQFERDMFADLDERQMYDEAKAIASDQKRSTQERKSANEFVDRFDIAAAKRLGIDFKDIQQYRTLMTVEEQYKKCPGCDISVDRIDGCNKMKCIECGIYWCWVCRYSSKTKTEREFYNEHLSDNKCPTFGTQFRPRR